MSDATAQKIDPAQLHPAFPRTRHLLWLEFGNRKDFDDPRHEWRRLFSEMLGTFFLVLVAAGGGLLHAKGQISLAAAVVAPGLMVMAIILFMGAVSGAHLNPAVSLAFALRGDFPWNGCPATSSSSSSARHWPAFSARRCSETSSTWGRRCRARAMTSWQALLMETALTTRPGQRDPRYRVGGAERRRDRRARRRRLYRPGRPLGSTGQRRLDEPGPLVRPRPGQRRFLQLLGVRGRARRRGADRRRLCAGAARPGRHPDLAGRRAPACWTRGPWPPRHNCRKKSIKGGSSPGRCRHRCPAERAITRAAPTGWQFVSRA